MRHVEIETIEAGDTVLGGADDVECSVLRVDCDFETVAPLAGRPRIRLWVQRDDTGDEGYMSFGPGGLARVPD